MPQQGSISRSPATVAIFGWLVPGGGYCLIGQKRRGITVGVTIALMFAFGLLIGGLRVVEAPTFQGGNPLDLLRQLISQKPWMLGQVLAGPLCFIPLAIQRFTALPVSHARINEIGTLYTAIAGMLNLMVVIDAAWRAGHPQEEQA